ncbi:MAG: response regulator transcription factor [Acidobacteria bacterium]|nr:response regulator transcription factor [Acidobacteriota bacterium]
MSRILLVEDEQHLAEGLKFNLEAEGYEVDIAETGEAGLDRLAADRFDLLVLDVMLPGINGFDVASRLRAMGNFIPTLMLTARGQAQDVLKGFESGADDYLAKPFELAILLARVGGLLRRREWLAPVSRNVIEVNGRAIDFENLELRDNGKTTPLTRMEADLLRYLADHDGQTISRKTLLDEVWGVHEDTDTRAIDNFIVRLRRYLEDEPARPRHLLTVRGIGYRFVADPGPRRQ